MTAFKKLGIMISAAPADGKFSRGLRAAETGLRDGWSVYLYCIDGAVEGLRDPMISQLKEGGVKLFACAYSMQMRGLEHEGAATLAGLTVLSDLIASTDKFVSFNAA